MGASLCRKIMHPEFKEKTCWILCFAKARRSRFADKALATSYKNNDIVEDLLRKVEIHRVVDESEYAEAFGYQQTVFRQQLTRIAVIPLNEVLDEEPSLVGCQNGMKISEMIHDAREAAQQSHWQHKNVSSKNPWHRCAEPLFKLGSNKSRKGRSSARPKKYCSTGSHNA